MLLLTDFWQSGDASWSPALGRGIDAANASDGELVIPRQVFDMGAKVTKTVCQRIRIVGDGTMRWTNADGGIDLTYTSAAKAPRVEGVTLLTTVAGGGAALKITSPVSSWTQERGAFVSDVSAKGEDGHADWWTDHVSLVNCWFPTVLRLSVNGYNDDITSSLTAVKLDTCTGAKIQDATLFHVNRGIQSVGSSMGEGLQVRGGEMVGVKWGIDHSLQQSAAGTSISDIHINASYRCITLNNQVQMSVHDILGYKTNFSTLDWQGIELVNCYDCKIHDNNLATPGVSVGSQNGITLVHSNFNDIEDNRFSYWASGGGCGVLVVATSDYNKIRRNVKPDTDTYPASLVVIGGDAGTHNLVEA